MMRALVTIAALVVIFAGIKASASLVVPFLLALFLAVLVSPPFLRMKKMGLPATVAMTVMIFGLGVICVLAVTILKTSLDQFSVSLPAYEANLRTQIDAIARWLETTGMESPHDVLANTLNPQFAMNYAGLIATAMSGMLGQALIIFVTAAFMLVEAGSFDGKLRAIPGVSEEGLRALQSNIQDVRRYVSLKSVMSLLTGALVMFWLWLLGVDNALFMGLLAFFLNFVPAIGSFVAAIPGVLLGLIQLGPLMAVVTAIGYLVINIGISNVIEPKFLGENLGMSPLVVIMSLVFWGWLLGPVGMLLSVPLTMVVKVILENVESTKGIAVLIGPPPKT